MELRKHPRMTWQGQPNWPPNWSGPHGPNNPLPVGEVGILTRVETGATAAAAPYCILVIRCNDQDYFGGLFFDDLSFLEQVTAVLRQHLGLSLAEIGNLNIP